MHTLISFWWPGYCHPQVLISKRISKGLNRGQGFPWCLPRLGGSLPGVSVRLLVVVFRLYGYSRTWPLSKVKFSLTCGAMRVPVLNLYLVPLVMLTCGCRFLKGLYIGSYYSMFNLRPFVSPSPLPVLPKFKLPKGKPFGRQLAVAGWVVKNPLEFIGFKKKKLGKLIWIYQRCSI